MGGLSSLVTSAVETAKRITSGLQLVVKYEKCLGDEQAIAQTAGQRFYDDPVEYDVVLSSRTRFLSVDGGAQSIQVSTIQFLDPLLVTVRDRITLPDGTCPQILAVEGSLMSDGRYYAPRVLF